MTAPAISPERPRTDLKALKTRVKVRGLAVIDKRTVAARHLLEWRRDLLADLGGEINVSAQQTAMVEMAVRTRLFVDHVDAILLGFPTLTNRRGNRLKPLVLERQRLVDSLAKILGQLGLQRHKPPVKSLSEYIAEQRAAEAGNGGEHEAEHDHAEPEQRPKRTPV